MSAAAGYALQGNMGRALAELTAVSASEFGAKDSAVRSCMIERFTPEADGSLPTQFGPFSNRAIGIYRAYWRASLLRPESRALEEQRLHRNLARLTGLPIAAQPNLIEAQVKERFAKESRSSEAPFTTSIPDSCWSEQHTLTSTTCSAAGLGCC